MNVIVVLIFVLMESGCNLSDSPPKEDPEPDIEQYFRAKLNGESWSGEPKASLMNLDGLPWLNLFATRYDTLRYPYNDHISFAIHFDSSKTDYKVLRKKEENNRTSGGSFRELDGDAFIAVYHPIPDSLNALTVHLEEEEGHRLVTGSFAMTVVVHPDYDFEPNNRYRQYPDTVRITGGEFRVLLEERE